MTGSIYRITNTFTDDLYVGQTTKTITHRYSRHLASARCGSETHLHRAIRKYGESAFSVSLVEEVDITELEPREQYWIRQLLPSYNMTAGGEGSRGRVLSAETKEKIRQSLLGKSRSIESRQKQSRSNTGRKCSPCSSETKQKISISKKGTVAWNRGIPNSLGNKGVQLSEEHKRNISKGRMGIPPWNKGKTLVACGRLELP